MGSIISGISSKLPGLSNLDLNKARNEARAAMRKQLDNMRGASLKNSSPASFAQLLQNKNTSSAKPNALLPKLNSNVNNGIKETREATHKQLDNIRGASLKNTSPTGFAQLLQNKNTSSTKPNELQHKNPNAEAANSREKKWLLRFIEHTLFGGILAQAGFDPVGIGPVLNKIFPIDVKNK